MRSADRAYSRGNGRMRQNDNRAVGRVLGKDILFGLNILSLAGFLVMGIGLTLNRQRKIGFPAAFALMGAGTGLLLVGLYAGGSLTR